MTERRLSRPIRAREEQADHYFREMMEIADEPLKDNVEAARARNRIDVRKFAVARLAPKKYGDRVSHDVQGNTTFNVQPAVLINVGPAEVSAAPEAGSGVLLDGDEEYPMLLRRVAFPESAQRTIHVMFITTANTLKIPPPLMDRMEIIRKGVLEGAIDKQPRATPFYEHPPSSTPVLDFAACFWESQINRYDYLRGPKEIDESPFYCRCDRPCAATTEARWAWKEDGPPQRHPRPKGRYDTRSLFSKLHSPEKT